MSPINSAPAPIVLAEAGGCSCCTDTTATQRGDGTVTDPVCGMAVRRTATTPTATHSGSAYYFCAPGCRRAFKRDPEAYASIPPNAD
ncbi:YHS domain-containing protein [Blastococcus aurantiacus]|uniref:YHS domain-containing protein n=1 Tax=Blastococcus aurantiacus TaxID=1550231 RepID=A0A1G7R3Y5_9ACTN|nr:YHS domain-containing protein [Blastococcus aurantiacus]SDG05455.1 YHS domain-containing protein [Blastococcus aurantiacus]